MSEEYSDKDRIVELESVAQIRLNGWHKANEIIEQLRADLAAKDAEIERLRGIIRMAEWKYTIGEYDAYNDRTPPDKYECLNCGFVFLADMPRSHAETCPFYQWEGGK